MTTIETGRWGVPRPIPILLATALLLSAGGAGLRAQQPTSDKNLPPKGIPEGYRLVEGDILVPVLITEGTYSMSLWPSGVVYYEFDSNVNAANQTAILQAMNDWKAVANVQFLVRTSQADYVHIQNSTGNNSAVGHQGGEQYANIFNWNSEFIMAHELGHCLGYWHEQSRTDRNTYVTINTSNIQPAFASNFALQNDSMHYGPYDFDSVMEYGQCDFSVCCPAGFTCGCAGSNCYVITVLPPNDTLWQNNMGQRNHLSAMDKLLMSFLYPQGNWRFADITNNGAQLGTFLQPYKQVTTAAPNTPAGGTLWIQPGTYSAVGSYNTAMAWKAPLGSVALGN